MEPKAKVAAVPRARPPALGRQLRQRWREAWDAMSLSGQLRVAVIAVVTLTILLTQLAVASYDVVANYVQSRDHLAQVPGAILQGDGELGSTDILAGVQAQPSVIAATLQLPSPTVARHR
jgi:hypothetical protein